MSPTELAAVARRFKEDGFLALENFFSDQEITEISDEMDKVITGQVPDYPEDDLMWEPGSDPPRLRNAFRPHLYVPYFMDLARNRKLTQVMEEILGRPLRLYGTQLFAKPPLVGTTVPTHQDMPYWPFEPYELVNAWIALDDSTLENGCVRFRAGSHKLGMLPHEPSGVAGNSLGLIENPRVSALPEVAVEVRRGACVLHHCLTVHRSEPNRSPKPRRGLVYIYMSPRVRLTDPSRLRMPAEFPEVSEPVKQS